jgi:hypothetical protein
LNASTPEGRSFKKITFAFCVAKFHFFVCCLDSERSSYISEICFFFLPFEQFLKTLKPSKELSNRRQSKSSSKAKDSWSFVVEIIKGVKPRPKSQPYAGDANHAQPAGEHGATEEPASQSDVAASTTLPMEIAKRDKKKI